MQADKTSAGLEDRNTAGYGSITWLVAIMKRLLAPDGCPWDREQSLNSLRPFLIEECYEVLDAIDSGIREKHCEELGDVLLQIVFQAELAGISLQEIIGGVGEKLIRRHPHVFGDKNTRETLTDSDEVLRRWEKIKRAERGNRDRKSALDGIPRALPALQLSHELIRKAQQGKAPKEPELSPVSGQRLATGDDPTMPWRQRLGNEIARALDQRLGTVRNRVRSVDSAARPTAGVQTVVGNILFGMVQWAHELRVEPEQALRDTARQFDQAFRAREASSTADPSA